MNRPLPAHAAQAAVSLQRQGFSRRWIARRLQIAPQTIAARCREAETDDQHLPPTRLPCDDEAPPGYDAANVRRCEGCGSLVYLWPCLGCKLAAMPRPAPIVQVGVQLGVQKQPARRAITGKLARRKKSRRKARLKVRRSGIISRERALSRASARTQLRVFTPSSEGACHASA
jgi:hypothetical protein